MNTDQAISPAVGYRTVNSSGMKIFYREAGESNAPALLLLHGFPTSSHMFRGLIPLLAGRYHVIARICQAPASPKRGNAGNSSTHSTILPASSTISRIQSASIALRSCSITAPRSGSLALKHPERVAAIISQNGNAYEEGLSDR